MSYKKRTIEKLYSIYLPKDYAVRVSLKTRFSERWVREVRAGKARNAQIEDQLLRLVKIGIKKSNSRIQKINFYAKSV